MIKSISAMKKIELLAPAGDLESFKAAINNKADAIYIGGKSFSNRAFASNFTNEEIKDMIAYAHIHEVKVYVGINITLYEEEISSVLEFVDFLYINDVDAIIASDLGLISILRLRYPLLDIHVSTQVNTHSLYQIKFLEELNVKRVILARETSIQTIQYIIKNTNLEIEVFCHGALCVCTSGKCLQSSFIGNRSGNRGACAQPCRMEYTLLEDNNPKNNKAYLMSLKDLNTLDNVDKLIKAGVSSLKIEGRMRSKEYVGMAVSAYRKAIDAYYLNSEINKPILNKKLALTFSREFTKGFIFNESNGNINNSFRPNNLGILIGEVIDLKNEKLKIKLIDKIYQKDKIVIVNDKKDDTGLFLSKIFVNNKLVNKAFKDEIIEIPFNSKVYKGSKVYKVFDYNLAEEINMESNNDKKVPVNVKLYVKVNEPLTINIKDNVANFTVTSDYICEKALKVPTSNEQLTEKISQLGNFSYYIKELRIDNDNLSIVPLKFVNELKNRAFEMLNQYRANRYHRETSYIKDFNLIPDYKEVKSSINVSCFTFDQLKAISEFNGINTIYFRKVEEINKAKAMYPNLNIVPYLPSIDNNNELIEANKYLVANLGDLVKYANKNITSDIYLNVTNSYTVATLLANNVSLVGLSTELTFDQINNIVTSFENNYGFIPPLEVLVYGRINTMVSKYCVIASTLGFKGYHCNSCKKHSYSLKDRMDYEFPILTDSNCNVYLFNSKKLHLNEYVDKLKEINIASIRLDFTTETEDETYDVLSCYINKEDVELRSVTYGYFKN